MTKTIQLTQGKEAIIDDCDFDLVMNSGYKWCAVKGLTRSYTYYVVGNGGTNPRRILMHQLIMGKPQNGCLDHKDGNGLNNRRENLRVATLTQNCANRRVHKNSKSGFKGVYYEPRKNRYIAHIKKNYKRFWLGSFRDPIDAAKAYDSAATKHFGEFARLNEIG